MIKRSIILLPLIVLLTIVPALAMSRVSIPQPILKEDIPRFLKAFTSQEIVAGQSYNLGTMLHEPGVLEKYLEILAGDDSLAKANVAVSLRNSSQPPSELLLPLLDALDTDSSVHKVIMIQAIPKYGDSVIPHMDKITAHFSDQDQNVLLQLAIVIGNMAPDSIEALPYLVDQLESPVSGVTHNAAINIGKFGLLAEETLPKLTETCGITWSMTPMDERNPFLQIGDASIPYLVELLGAEFQKTREFARRSILKYGMKAEDHLIAAIETVPGAKGYIGILLADIGSKKIDAVPLLILDLRSGDKDIIRIAAEALGKMGPAAGMAIPVLLELSEDKDHSIKRYANNAIERIGIRSTENVQGLMKLLENEKYQLRKQAAEALGLVGPIASAAVEGLVALANDPAKGAYAEAIGAIGQIHSGDMLLQTLRRINSSNATVRKEIAVQLAEAGKSSDEAIEWLIDILSDTYSTAATQAKVSLAELGDRATPFLADALSSSETKLRQAAAETLFMMGSDAVGALPALIAALEDVREVLLPVVETLGAIGKPAADALPILRDIAANDQYVDQRKMVFPVRVAAREAIVQIESGGEE